MFIISVLILSPVQVTQFTWFNFSLQFSLNCNDTVPTQSVVYSISITVLKDMVSVQQHSAATQYDSG